MYAETIRLKFCAYSFSDFHKIKINSQKPKRCKKYRLKCHRTKKIMEEINSFPKSNWKRKRVVCAGNKARTLGIFNIVLCEYILYVCIYLIVGI
jgi:hypothetical protein